MDTDWEFILQEDETEYYCILCGCYMCSIQNVKQHYYGNRHRDSLDQYGNDISYKGSNNKYYCNVCDCTISGYQNVRSHVIGKGHEDCTDETESEASDISIQYTKMDSKDFIVRQDDCELLECIICNCDIENNVYLQRSHLYSRKHEVAFSIYGSDINDSESGWYYCRLCDCEINSYKNVYDHITGKKHENNLP